MQQRPPEQVPVRLVAWQCSGLELQFCNYLTIDLLGELFYIYGAPGKQITDKHAVHEVGRQSKPVG